MTSRNTAIIIGGAVGAVLGATAAWVYTQAQQGKLTDNAQAAGQLRLRAGAPDYVKVGISLFALLRQITDLLKPD